MESLPNEILVLIASKLMLKDRAKWGLCGRKINDCFNGAFGAQLVHRRKMHNIFNIINNSYYDINSLYSDIYSISKIDKVRIYNIYNRNLYVISYHNYYIFDVIYYKEYYTIHNILINSINPKPSNIGNRFAYPYIKNDVILLCLDENILKIFPKITIQRIKKNVSKITKNKCEDIISNRY